MPLRVQTHAGCPACALTYHPGRIRMTDDYIDVGNPKTGLLIELNLPRCLAPAENTLVTFFRTRMNTCYI